MYKVDELYEYSRFNYLSIKRHYPQFQGNVSKYSDVESNKICLFKQEASLFPYTLYCFLRVETGAPLLRLAKSIYFCFMGRIVFVRPALEIERPLTVLRKAQETEF